MTFENKNLTVCPAANMEVLITELYDAEAGGSCQADVTCISISCSQESTCEKRRKHAECLLNCGAF